jgi:hypothetical protein
MPEGCVPSFALAPAGVSDGKPRYRGTCSCGWEAATARSKKWAAQSDAIEHANESRPVLTEASSRPSSREYRNPVTRPHGGGGSAA